MVTTVTETCSVSGMLQHSVCLFFFFFEVSIEDFDRETDRAFIYTEILETAQSGDQAKECK